MNRVFWVLILSATLTAFFGDVFGPPLHLAVGALVDESSLTTVQKISTTGFGAASAFKVSAKGTNVVIAVRGLQSVENLSPQIEMLRASGVKNGTLDLGFTFLKDGAVTGSLQLLLDVNDVSKANSERISLGLAKLKTYSTARGQMPRMKKLTAGIFSMAETAADLALGLIGILSLWMGVLKVAEAAGLVAVLARILRPILVRLFPDIPPEHPAMGAMVMNIAANMLGLGNAATPLGLEAMRRLQSLKPKSKTASNAMVLFLAINTSGLTLLPAKTMALRAQNGSDNPAAILLPTLLATMVSTLVAIVIAKLLAPRFVTDEQENDSSENVNRLEESDFAFSVSAKNKKSAECKAEEGL